MKDKLLKTAIFCALFLNVLEVLGQAQPQKPGCDLFPDFLESRRVKAVCEQHDRAYERNNCTVRSWLPRSGQDPECSKANAEAAEKITLELLREATERAMEHGVYFRPLLPAR